MKKFLMASVILVCLAACSDKPQSAGGVKGDTAPYAGTGKGYVEGTWKQGDKQALAKQN